MKTVAITGGGGYIGGQTAIYFKEQGWDVTVVDRTSLSEHLEPFVDRFLHDEFQNPDALNKYASADCIVHCAGSSLVGPSIKNPSDYYENNFIATKRMLDYICQFGYHPKIVFSSSAAVYGDPIAIPIAEEDPKLPISPYGISKHMVEQLLETYSEAYGLNYVGLRYFNAAGADPDGEVGELREKETHIVPLAIDAARQGRTFKIFGDKYPTEDGTCVRDYVHVMDLADAHIKALNYANEKLTSEVFNLGSGAPASNRQLLDTIQKYTGQMEIEMWSNRPGDPAYLVADIEKAKKELGWEPTQSSIDNVVATAVQWYNKTHKKEIQ